MAVGPLRSQRGGQFSALCGSLRAHPALALPLLSHLISAMSQLRDTWLPPPRSREGWGGVVRACCMVWTCREAASPHPPLLHV